MEFPQPKRVKIDDSNSVVTNNDVNLANEIIIEILIVDDSPTILKVISEMLRKKGYYAVDVANSSPEAIQILKKKVYDIALVDVNLPQLSGLELSSRFRDFESKADAFARQKIIGMTSDFGETKMQDVINAGMDSFIFKPFQIQKFEELSIIKNLLEEKKKLALKAIVERERKKSLAVLAASSNMSIPSDHDKSVAASASQTNPDNQLAQFNPNGSATQTSVPFFIPPLSLLVVDDSPTILKIITKMLEKAGHSVETQSSGLAALERLKMKTYDCVLMDINMPQWGGLEVSFEYRIHEYEQKQYFEYMMHEQAMHSNTHATNNNNNNNNNSSSSSSRRDDSKQTEIANKSNSSAVPVQPPIRFQQKIIAMTGEVNPKLDTEVMFGGFNGMLHKPFTLQKFNKIVSSLINYTGNTTFTSNANT